MIVRKILVDVDDGVEELASRENVRTIFQKKLEEHSLFRVDESSSSGMVARLYLHSFSMGPAPTTRNEADHLQKPAGQPVDIQNVLTVALSVAFTASNTDKDPKKSIQRSLQGHGAGTTTLSGKMDVSTVSEPLIASAVEKAFKQIESRHSVGRQSSDELIANLRDVKTPREQRLTIVETLGAREEKKATPVLVEIMKAEDRELAQYAVGALARIGAPAAVDDLIQYATGKPASMRKLVIEAMRKAGTKKAKAWLFTLSTGHPDPEVQLAAKSALTAVTAEQGQHAGANQIQ